MIEKRIHAAIAVVVSLCMASQAFAVGTASYSTELISTRSLGQGNIGVAGVSDDPVSAYRNPAAMTALSGTQIMTAITYLNARPTYTDQSGSVTGARATSVGIPAFAMTSLLNDKWSVGLSVISPYGSETHFNGDSPLRYIATDSRLGIVLISPAVAYKINDQFSFGVGADYANVIEGQVDRKIDEVALNFALAGGFPGSATGSDANSRLNGNGDGWGYHAGLTYKPNEHHSIGLVYHSNIKIWLNGNLQLTDLNGGLPGFNSVATFGGTSFSTNISAPLYLPQNVQLGYAFMPNKQWMFEADMAWYDWFAARQLGVVLKDNLTSFQKAVLNAPAQQFNPRKTINFGTGVNYKHNDKLQLRSGFLYEAATQAESGFAPGFIDLPRYGIGGGFGYAFTPTVGMDFAYNYLFYHTRYISNNLGFNNTGDPAQNIHGSFSNHSQSVSVSMTVKLPGWGK